MKDQIELICQSVCLEEAKLFYLNLLLLCLVSNYAYKVLSWEDRLLFKLPSTWRKTEKLILGSVLTWHWYSPASRSWVYLICSVHASVSTGWWALKRWSPVKVSTSLVNTCRSALRIQETWKKIKKPQVAGNPKLLPIVEVSNCWYRWKKKWIHPGHYTTHDPSGVFQFVLST